MKNLLEGAVRDIYADLGRRYPEYCRCDNCQADVLAWALNHARPRYSGGNVTGMTLTYVDLQRDQTRAAIAVIVLDAMRRVAANPRHDAPRDQSATKP